MATLELLIPGVLVVIGAAVLPRLSSGARVGLLFVGGVLVFIGAASGLGD